MSKNVRLPKQIMKDKAGFQNKGTVEKRNCLQRKTKRENLEKEGEQEKQNT